MPTFHVKLKTTVTQTYTVEAAYESDARKMVRDGDVFADGDVEVVSRRIVEAWPLADVAQNRSPQTRAEP